MPAADIIDPITDRVSMLTSSRGCMLYATVARRYATSALSVAKVATSDAFKTGIC